MKHLTAPQQGLLSSVTTLMAQGKPWKREFDPPEVAIALQYPDMSARSALFFVLNNRSVTQ